MWLDLLPGEAGNQPLRGAGCCTAVAAVCSGAASTSRVREAVGSLLSTGEVTPGNNIQLGMLERVRLGLQCWAGLGTEGGERGAGAARCGEEEAGSISKHRDQDVKGDR